MGGPHPLRVERRTIAWMAPSDWLTEHVKERSQMANVAEPLTNKIPTFSADVILQSMSTAQGTVTPQRREMFLGRRLRRIGVICLVIIGIQMLLLFCHYYIYDLTPEFLQYHEPIVSVTRIPVMAAPPELSRSLFHFSLTPSVSLFATRLLLLVISAPAEFQRRQWIRSSWGSVNHLRKYQASLIFVVGRCRDHSITNKLRQEHKHFKDLLFDEYLTEDYSNLTRKVLAALYWTSIQRWIHLRFVAKVDSDTFLSMKQLTIVAEMLPPGLPCIVGKVWLGTEVIRSTDHKWHVSTAKYPLKYFPNYANGPSYLISKEAVSRLVCLETILELIHNQELFLEDVYITGILRQRLGIELRDVKTFFIPMPNSTNATDLRAKINGFVSVHSLKDKDLARFKDITT